MTRRIVVGIDGSEDGQRALAWAIDEARARGGAVEVVHVWTWLGASTIEADTRQLARETLDVSVAKAETDGVDVRARLIEGRPVASLVGAAKGADLLVVGSRGHGGLAATVLGSVSTGVVHHAPCPIVVVPPERQEPPTEEPGAVGP